ncbi:hypothetical protein [Ruminococcus gauvreauii]|uniref:Uncharacterized protein n=1 Tax=Ruminococcus gauvreauii TaxID=438033 RepID=A0ABY5VK48_9FIRM|nr:hypothetical protein [Ruminococcus gauvreauii]UWP60428.1 hypothetical protein NQ502_05140 [Ruminococcus gauvreauii]
MEKPLGYILDAIENELEAKVFECIRNKGVPPSLMEYILTKVQCTVKDLKMAEYTEIIMREDAETGESVKMEEGESSECDTDL